MTKGSILITGANGLLGQHFINLHRSDYSLCAAVRVMPERPLEGVNYHIVDFAKDWSPDDLPDDIDTICHFAQSDNFRDFPDKAQDVFDVNIASTARLLDYGHRRGAKNFIYASSGGVYAATNSAFKENSPLAASHELGYYLGSKRCGEILAANYSSLLNVSILRFFFIYGAGQKRTMLLPRLVDNVRAGNPITLQGEQGLLINPIHARDAAVAVEKCIGRSESATFNIAGKNTYSLKEVAELIGEKTGQVPMFEHQDAPPKDIVADISAMESTLHKPQISLGEGLADLL